MNRALVRYYHGFVYQGTGIEVGIRGKGKWMRRRKKGRMWEREEEEAIGTLGVMCLVLVVDTGMAIWVWDLARRGKMLIAV